MAAPAGRGRRAAALRGRVPRLRPGPGPGTREAVLGGGGLRAPDHGQPGPGVERRHRRHARPAPLPGRHRARLPHPGRRRPGRPLLPAADHRRGALRRGRPAAPGRRPRAGGGHRLQPGRRPRARGRRAVPGRRRGHAGRAVPVRHPPGRARRRPGQPVRRGRRLPRAAPRRRRPGVPHAVLPGRRSARAPGDRAGAVLDRPAGPGLPAVDLLRRLPPLRRRQGRAGVRVQRPRGRRGGTPARTAHLVARHPGR